MNPALWGGMTALGWGGADFIARFTGRALGPDLALFGMLGIGAVVLTIFQWQWGGPLVWDAAGWWLLLGTGIGVAAATMLLYWGLARGPISVVAPIVGAYPALNLALAVALGVTPSAIEWAAMAQVVAGVLIVARSGAAEAPGGPSRRDLTRTVWIALASALGFALTVAAAQGAKEIYGELQTVWLGRWISLACVALFLAGRRKPPLVAMRWWPWLAGQGLLDAGAYVALLAGSQAVGSSVVVVVASSFSAVTVLLARIVLKEAISRPQWLGIALIVTGVAVLSAQ